MVPWVPATLQLEEVRVCTADSSVYGLLRECGHFINVIWRWSSWLREGLSSSQLLCGLPGVGVGAFSCGVLSRPWSTHTRIAELHALSTYGVLSCGTNAIYDWIGSPTQQRHEQQQTPTTLLKHSPISQPFVCFHVVMYMMSGSRPLCYAPRLVALWNVIVRSPKRASQHTQ